MIVFFLLLTKNVVCVKQSTLPVLKQELQHGVRKAGVVLPNQTLHLRRVLSEPNLVFIARIQDGGPRWLTNSFGGLAFAQRSTSIQEI